MHCFYVRIHVNINTIMPLFFFLASKIGFVNFLSLVWKNMVLALNQRMNDDSLRESYNTKQLSITYGAFYHKK